MSPACRGIVPPMSWFGPVRPILGSAATFHPSRVLDGTTYTWLGTSMAEDLPHGLGFAGDNDQLAVLYPVAERRHASHPPAFLFRRGNLVADAFAGDLAFELGKGQQHIEGEPAH